MEGEQDLPEALLRGSKEVVEHFDADERLYRRFPPTAIDRDGKIDIAAIELPDISVNRSTICHDPDWARRYDTNGVDCSKWGVAFVTVGTVPLSFVHSNGNTYSFPVMHAPKKRNYSHSVIQCHEDGRHLTTLGTIPDEVHLRLRRRIRTVMKFAIMPTREAAE